MNNEVAKICCVICKEAIETNPKEISSSVFRNEQIIAKNEIYIHPECAIKNGVPLCDGELFDLVDQVMSEEFGFAKDTNRSECRFLTNNELNHLAFRLVVSSTPSYYNKQAKEISKKTEIAKLAYNRAGILEEILKRAETLLSQIISKDSRDLEEIELAGLLPIIADNVTQKSCLKGWCLNLLHAVADRHEPTARNVTALAKQLILETPNIKNETPNSFKSLNKEDDEESCYYEDLWK